MIFLVDYNLTGYVVLFQGTLAAEGWLELLSIRFVTLSEMGLAADTNDRLIWRFAQSHQMLLLTANRNAKGEDSLEQTIREEGTLITLPVITISSLDRLLRESIENSVVRVLLKL